MYALINILIYADEMCSGMRALKSTQVQTFSQLYHLNDIKWESSAWNEKHNYGLTNEHSS